MTCSPGKVEKPRGTKRLGLSRFTEEGPDVKGGVLVHDVRRPDMNPTVERDWIFRRLIIEPFFKYIEVQ